MGKRHLRGGRIGPASGLTRLLLERGADPNDDDETPYHAPETYNNEAAQAVLVESGKLNARTA